MSTGAHVGKDQAQDIYSTGRCVVATCGNHTYVTSAQYDLLQETGATFYCIAGHGQSFTPKRKRDEEKARRKALEREARESREEADRAERRCPWPTCEGRLLASPKGLRQHMVKTHGAPWATAEIDPEDVAQVLNGRDPVDTVR